MIEIELPDGSVAEFPDGTPDTKIKSALSKFKKTPAAAPTPAPAASKADVVAQIPTGEDRPVPPSDPIQREAWEKVSQLPKWRHATYGAERTLDEYAMGAKQLISGLSEEEKHDLAVRRAMEQELGTTSGVSRFAGDVLTALPAAKIISKVSTLPKTRAAQEAVKYGGAVTAGALSGAVKPVIGEEDRGTNAMVEGAAGLGGQAFGDIVGAGIKGVVAQNPAVAALPKAVRDVMTLGQQADPRSVTGNLAKAMEERVQSYPVVGSVVKNQRDAAVNTWRQSLIDDALPPNMKSTSNVGHVRDQVGEISDEFERQYGNVLKNVKIKYNPTFDSRIDQIINDPKRGLTPDARNELRNVIRGYYHDMFPQYTGMGNRATVTGDRAKQFEAFLTKQEQNWRKATNNPQSSNIAGILDDLEADWTNAYRSGLPVNVQKTLKPLDDQYSKFATVREAATSLGNDYGDFTPEQLLAAVKKRTARPRFAESGGIMQRPAEVGKDVFSERTRSSGTIERGALGAFGLGLLVDPLTTLGTTGAATGGAFLSTTGPGKNLLLGQTRPQKLLQRLKADKGARALGMPLGLGGVQSITDEDILEQ